MLSSASAVAPGALLKANARLSTAKSAAALLSSQQQTRSFSWWNADGKRDAQRRTKAAHPKTVLEQQNAVGSEAPRRNASHLMQSKRTFVASGSQLAKESKPNVLLSGKQEAWTSASILNKIGISQASVMPKAVKPKAKIQAASDFVVDPTTNRKISKSSAKSAPDETVGVPPTHIFSVPTFDPDFPPTAKDRKHYNNVVVDEIVEKEQGSEYKDLHKYEKHVSWNEPDGKPTNEPVELGHEGYDPAEVSQYKPFRYNEPNGQPTAAPVELGHEGYDPEEVKQYKPFMYNEPEGKKANANVELGHHGYCPVELSKYGPYFWNEEFDGKVVDAVTEAAHRGVPVTEVEKYRAAQGQRASTEVELGHLGYDPAEVSQYKPFYWNEATGGQPTDAKVELGHHGYDAAEVQQYQAVRFNEPHGQLLDVEIEVGHAGYDQAEVKQYQPYQFNEPDGQLADVPVELGHHGYDQAEVQQYKAIRFNEPDGQMPDVEPAREPVSLAPEPAQQTFSEMLGAFKNPSTKEASTATSDLYSTVPTGLETAYAREVGSAAGLTYFKVHGPSSTANTSNSSTSYVPPPPASPSPPGNPSSNIVRRTELVFSGPKQEAREAKTPRVGRRMLVGATSLGSISYGLGVVSELFV